MELFPYRDLEEALKIGFRMKNGTPSLKVKITRLPYSREKKNKYARRIEVGGCLLSIK